ncbi:MAG TPA: hypothetical protein PKI93_08215 [Alphaproteobacteria bacterium]|nr:hypothetical protein [Alphaproteobacteria bacterium]HNS44095.1 hypothetical protein [Alphaproteobacteria bacterium]
MIEAVNAAVSNAQVIRAVAEQTASTQSFAANPTRVQTAGVTAPYLSPHVDLNGGSSKPILVVRDSETGDRVRQFPTEGQIRAYQRAQANQARAEASAQAEAQFRAQQQSADLVESSVQYRQARQEVKVQQNLPLPGSGKSGDTGTRELKVGGSGATTGTKTTGSLNSVDTEA